MWLRVWNLKQGVILTYLSGPNLITSVQLMKSRQLLWLGQRIRWKESEACEGFTSLRLDLKLEGGHELKNAGPLGAGNRPQLTDSKNLSPPFLLCQ